MNLALIGRKIAELRRAKGLTLGELAASAGIGRSTLAALEGGKLAELGFTKVARVCATVGLVLELRPAALEAPLMAHRHLTEAAGRDLTKAAIADVIERGDLSAWRGLVRSMRSESGEALARRVEQIVGSLDQSDCKVRAFATLLPDLLASHPRRRPRHA